MVHRNCNCSTAMACIGHMTCMPAASVDLEMSHFVRQTQMFDKLHSMVLSRVYKRRRCILLGFSVQLDRTHDVCRGIEIEQATQP